VHSLPLANILHHKLRSFLAALGIGIGVCMLITLSGLARGSLHEVADRWESVDADLIVTPAGWGHQFSARIGSGVPDAFVDRIRIDYADTVQTVVPVFFWQIELGGQRQMTAGIDAADWAPLTGEAKLVAGRLFDPDGKAARWLTDRMLSPVDDDTFLEITAGDLATNGCLELIIDQRLAEAGDYRVGQIVRAANHDWTIVGIAPTGVVTRAFVPRRTAQFLFASGDVSRSSVLFVKLIEDDGAIGPVAREMEQQLRVDVVGVAEHRGMLLESFGVMFMYVDMVNVVALVIAFLFITIILYTMVIQQTRDIAILKANGASSVYLFGQVITEALLLTGVGILFGVALSFFAAWLIQHVKPLLTVIIEWRWIAAAVVASVIGAVLSSLYPAYRATRVDMAEALTLE